MGFRFMENQSFKGLLDKQNQVMQMMLNLGNDIDTLGLLKSCWIWLFKPECRSCFHHIKPLIINKYQTYPSIYTQKMYTYVECAYIYIYALWIWKYMYNILYNIHIILQINLINLIYLIDNILCLSCFCQPGNAAFFANSPRPEKSSALEPAARQRPQDVGPPS